ncbi:MAG: FixH family protein [Pyrinomonadaceae bacterium]
MKRVLLAASLSHDEVPWGNRCRASVRRSHFVISCVCVLALLVSACQQSPESSPSVTIAYEISPQPARIGPATITLRLSDPSGAAVTGARVTLEGNMSHAGMSPVFSEAKEIERGRYQAQFEFSMAGDWIVSVHSTLSDGKKLESHFEIKGVRSN